MGVEIFLITKIDGNGGLFASQRFAPLSGTGENVGK